MESQQTLLSGIQPSGDLHIGNYLGAIKQWVELQKTHRVFITIVDLHAITVPQDPEKLREKTLETAALLLACGIDPKKSVLFIQSHVPAHTELMWILNTLTPVRELLEMTQYKEKAPGLRKIVARGRAGLLSPHGGGLLSPANMELKEDLGNMGLLDYPILQAADILLYQPDIVPIGEDQLQHLELTRTLARKFNNRFGETFKEPKALINAGTGRIMGLDDPSKKMSKSAQSPNNYIALLDSQDEIRRKIKIAVTDSEKGGTEFYKKARPGVVNLLAIYAEFSDLTMADTLTKSWENYSNRYSELKHDVSEIVIEKLSKIQEKYKEISTDKEGLLTILNSGSQKAAEVANKTLTEVKNKIGLVPLEF